LDDTIEIYEKYHGLIKHFGFGNWVDGGCWATVEGRAILAYQKLGQYDDSFRAADWYMRWAEEYRQDAPLSQFGFNTNNPWSAENDDHTVCGRPVAIMIDNFATVTCILRGLFDYNADAYGLTIRPQIPDSITEMIQHEPIRFGNCKIYISYRSGTGAMYAMLDSTILEVSENGIIRIPADLLAGLKDAHLYIGCSGESEQTCTFKNEITLTGDIDGVPKDLIDIYNECKAALDTADGDLAVQLREILLSTEAAALRRKLPFDKHELRPMTDEKIEIIIGAYDNTVRELYKGLKYRR